MKAASQVLRFHMAAPGRNPCHTPYTVGRVITVYTSQRNDLDLYDKQVQRWQAETLTDEQREDLKHLVSHLQRLHTVIATVLKLADELKAHTIEKVLAKSDEELGLEFLMGMFQQGLKLRKLT